MRTITAPADAAVCIALRREGITFMPHTGDDHATVFIAHLRAWHVTIQETAPQRWTMLLRTAADDAILEEENGVSIDYVAAKWGPLLRTLGGFEPEIVSGGSGGAFAHYVTMRNDQEQRRYVVRADSQLDAEALAATRCRTGRVLNHVIAWRWV